jgi:pantetheine-phosphate adenylyltransferase
MASILLATLPSLAPPHFLESVIAHAVSHSSTRLVIVLFSRHFNANARSLTVAELQAVSHTRCWDIVQRILTFAYVQATKVAWQANNVLMPIDVLLKGFNEDLDPTLGIGMDVCYRVGGGQ